MSWSLCVILNVFPTLRLTLNRLLLFFHRKQVLLNRIIEQTYNGIRIENYYMYKYQVEKISD